MVLAEVDNHLPDSYPRKTSNGRQLKKQELRNKSNDGSGEAQKTAMVGETVSPDPSGLPDKSPPDIEEKENPCGDGDNIGFPIRFT